MAQCLLDIDICNHKFRMNFDTDLFSHKIMLHDMMTEKRPYEADTTRAFMEVLKPGDVCLDIGAHIGYFSLLASRTVGDKGIVIAVEPEASNYHRLLEHIKQNEAGNIFPVQSVVSDVFGEVDFYFNTDNDGAHCLWDAGQHPLNPKSKEAVIVKKRLATTVDNLCEAFNLDTVKLLKIDTEGAEVAILRGAQEMLSCHKISYVIAEVNDFGLNQMGTSLQGLKDLMNGYGYCRQALLDCSEPGDVTVCNMMFSWE